MQVRERVEKYRKVAVHCLFPMICGSRGSKSGLAQAAGAEPSGQRRDEQLHAALVRSTFRSKNVQNTPTSEHLWKMLKKRTPLWREAHCEVNVQNTSVSKHFWKLSCGKSARCTPLWHKTHFEIKMSKAHNVRTTFGCSTAPHYIHYNKILQLQLQLQQLQLQLQLQLPTHYNYNCSFNFHFTASPTTTTTTTALQYATVHYNTLQYTTVHYSTPQLQLQLQLHLHYNYNYIYSKNKCNHH